MSAPGHELDASTVSLWRLESESAPIADEAGNHVLGLNGVPVSAVGKINNAVLFAAGKSFRGTGIANATSLAMMTGVSQDFSLEAWVYLTALPGVDGAANGVVGLSNGTKNFGMTVCNVSGAGFAKVRFEWDGGAGINGSVTIPLNTWTHIAATGENNFNGTRQIKIYVAGALDVSTASANTQAATGTNTWRIAEGNAGGFCLVGRVDDVRVSSVARSLAAIQDSVARGEAPAAPVITSPVAASTVDIPRPVVAGTSDPDAVVTVYEGSTVLGVFTADGSGDWSGTVTQSLTQGSHTLTAIAADDAGGTSSLSAGVTFTVDLAVYKFARSLKQLLPRGRLWNLELGSNLERMLLAIGSELLRLVGRGEDLIEESDPRTATETLEDWERMLGLPDEQITTIPATDAARRLAITQKLIRQGGQHAGFYVALAAACGYTVTIDDSYGEDVFRAGTAVAGDALGGLWSAFQWGVTVTATAATALTHAELEAVIRRAAPAHTSVVFTY